MEHATLDPLDPPMKPTTDYVRLVARLARKLQLEGAMGGAAPQPDAEFYKALAKAMDEIATGLEQVKTPD
jgi:NAD dependent epimerase/dehydratase family enzyme